ncbi:sirohydrochlorin chelatase [Chitinimonas sp. BJYL2]|uniref:sirohydrochlorin chelatase n=1 Tax=Chitinimonas sp. BJYL2 TaxID=2976696 RepID=UPI0022B4E605|nr:CbiX/SirB N-terminal domain-containing protein [Chitinimonas sp. BJYL2]
MSHAIILFAHGARDPQWAEPFQRLRALLAAQRPDCHVVLAFLELMSPSLTSCTGELVAQGYTQISIVPAFMARGAHLRRDLPEMLADLRKQHPDIQFEVTEALGEAEGVLQAMAGWITRRIG